MEALFVRDAAGAVRGEMLAVAFECLLDMGGPRAYALNMIRAERVNHAEVGVPADAFGQFFSIVMQTCREILGVHWTPEISAAWTATLAELDTAIRGDP